MILSVLLWFPAVYGFAAYAALILAFLMISKIRIKKL